MTGFWINQFERELQIERGVYWERQLGDLLSQFHNFFFINHQPYHSRMLFLKGVFGGLVQQLPAGLWVIEGTRKIQKDGTFVNMGYIFDNLLCWLLIKLLTA